MQSIGDQVTALVSSLERDHIVALQRIDELIAANESSSAESAALKSANAVLEKQLTDRGDALAYSDKQLTDAIAQVEAVAATALNMLKVVRGFATIADVMPPAPRIVAREAIADIAAVDPRFANEPSTVMIAPIRAPFNAALIAAPPLAPNIISVGVQSPIGSRTINLTVVDDVIPEQDAPAARDSGDETDHAIKAAEIEDGVTLTPEERAEVKTASADFLRQRQRVNDALNDHEAEPAPSIAPPAIEISAVDRMRPSASLLPALTLVPRAPVERPGLMIVEHDRAGLPIFLQRDTVFGRIDSGPGIDAIGTVFM